MGFWGASLRARRQVRTGSPEHEVAVHLLSFTCGDLDGTRVEEEAQTHATSLEPEWCRRKDGEGNGNLLQYSCLGNPWTEEPGDYSPGGRKRVRHDFSDWTTTTKRRKGKYAAANSRQSCPALCYPIDGSPPGSPVPGILQARTLEWVSTSFCNAWKWKVKVNLLSRVRLSNPMDCSLPGSSVHGIFQARVLEWGDTAFSEG